MPFAIIQTGGKQHRVEPGQVIEVEKLPVDEGQTVELTDVLLVSDDSGLRQGTPLVDGVKVAGQVDQKIRFLRRIPKDPFTNSTDWGLRSTQDDPKAGAWGGQNVFDVYSKTTEKAGDGTPYSEW